MTKQNPTEKILDQALELHIRGASLLSIIHIYPEHEEEIRSLLDSVARLHSMRNHIVVPEVGLRRILAKLESIPEATERPVKSPFMILGTHSMVWKFVLPVLAVALLTGGYLFKTGNTPIEPTVTVMNINTATQTQAVPLKHIPEPTGNIDDMVAVLNNESVTESSIAKNGDAEKSAVTAPSSTQVKQASPAYENQI